jgi:hypothetical protein
MENRDSSIQQIAPDITLQWVYNGQIAIYTVRTVAIPSLHRWADSVEKVMTDWPIDTPLLVVQDQLFEGAAYTPAMRETAQRLSGYRPELKMCQAIILKKGFSTQVAKNAIWLLRKANRDNQIFFTLQDGLDWLKTKVQDTESKTAHI